MPKVAENLAYIDVGLLIPYAKNARTHSAKQVEQIAKSISEFGFTNPVLIDEKNEIIAGHCRIMAAKLLGLEKAPCIVISGLSAAQKKAYILADNKLALDAGWDMEMLKLELKDLTELGFDMDLTGFSDKELNNIFLDDVVVEDDFDVDKAAADIKEPISKFGDIWQLGDHRLCCGDSTNRKMVEQLLDGESFDMIFTDPPYNINYQGKTKDQMKILNDNMSDSKFYNFLFDVFNNLVSVTRPGGAVYVCHADCERLNFNNALLNAGWEVKECLIWVKNGFVLGRQDYHWHHEPILYGWKPGAAHKWCGNRRQSTVFALPDGATITELPDGKFQICISINGITTTIVAENPQIIEDTSLLFFNKPLKNDTHPTMKPISLCAKAIKNSSVNGDIVGGSGSTLMACEQIGRKCYTMELDTKFCDVIIQRWESFTGGVAKRIKEGGK